MLGWAKNYDGVWDEADNGGAFLKAVIDFGAKAKREPGGFAALAMLAARGPILIAEAIASPAVLAPLGAASIAEAKAELALLTMSEALIAEASATAGAVAESWDASEISPAHASTKRIVTAKSR